jgi:fructose-bisphosphate aldolase class II
MKTLLEYIHEAEQQKIGLGHFNFTTLDMFWGIFDAARKISKEEGRQIPLIVGVSEGERDFFGVQQVVDFVQGISDEYEYPIFINADHTFSVERAKEAINAGFDLVIIDGADKSYEENVAMTAEVVMYRDEVGSHALIEGELGYIGGGSSVKDTMPEGVSEATMTKPEEAKTFVQETGIDLLAPAVGNVHGIIRSGNPRLDPERTALIREMAGVPLVLHGGSGSTDEDFTAVIKKGMSMIHISTEIRKSYREALEKSLADNPDQMSPYYYLKTTREAVADTVYKRMKLFLR